VSVLFTVRFYWACQIRKPLRPVDGVRFKNLTPALEESGQTPALPALEKLTTAIILYIFIVTEKEYEK
jgi:hypothetical protein